MNDRLSLWLTGVTLLFTSACGGPESDSHDSAIALRGSSECPSWRCGFNAAEVNGHSLQELNLDGVPNAAGARIVGFVPPLLRLGYTLDFEDDELVARKGSSVIRGSQLFGAILLVQLPGGLPIPLTITDHDLVDSWAEGHPPIDAYTLTYPEPMELLGIKNVCTGSLLDPLASVATILGGERYDEATKTVLPGQSRWFTIACAGSAAAKMKLLGYGPQSSATTVAERQATLKMLTADYCGSGQSYTQNGTEVLWTNQDGSVVPPEGAAIGDVEAVWTDAGALCLDAPRIPGTVPQCTLPSCAGLDLDDGEWITHVPAE